MAVKIKIIVRFFAFLYDIMAFEIKGDIIEIKFSGDISPEKLTLDELSKELLLLNNLIKPIIEEQFPGQILPKDFAGLVDIGNRSLSFRYLLKQQRDLAIKALTILLIAVSTGDITTLPARTIETLERTSDFNERYGVVAHFGEVLENRFVSHISFSTEFKAEKIGRLKGPTTAYGYLKWIGGDKPHARLVLNDRSEISVRLTREQAREYSRFLYSFISVAGEATWKGPNLKLTSIDAEIIHAFENLSPEEGFEFLRKHLGKYWEDKDPNYFN